MCIKVIEIALKNNISLGARRIHPEFLRKVRKTQGQRSKDFLESLLDQDLEPNFRPKTACKCPKLANIVDKQKAQPASKHKASISDFLSGNTTYH